MRIICDLSRAKQLLILSVCLVQVILLRAQVDTLHVFSGSMQKTIPNLVILPEGYHQKKQAYPVLYLLHGAYGGHMDWLNRVPELPGYATKYDFIIVCPDGDPFSWYLDSPVDSSMRYETYFTKELLPQVDQQYRTRPNRAGRAITGLSMGGHGSWYLAIRHPALWGAAGSMSGGLDLRPFVHNWKLSQRLGNYMEHKENWSAHSVATMLDEIEQADLKLLFDCGVDDFFYPVNERLHWQLQARGIPHEYTSRPGGHSWDYWRNSLRYHLLFFADFFAEN